MDAALKPLVDRAAITDAIYRYARSMDRNDHKIGYSVWHDGAKADYGAPIYQGTGVGFIDYALEAHLNLIVHAHQMTCINIRLKGDRASTETYGTVMHRRRQGETLIDSTTRGRYLDKWSLRNGRWAIDERRYVHDLTEEREVTPWDKPGGDGARDRSDPSYALLGDAMDSADTLQKLQDRRAITQAIHNYCRSMDRVDVELGYSVWHEDGTADYGPGFRGTGREFIDFVRDFHLGNGHVAHTHQVANILIRLDGDKAYSETYVLADLLYREGDKLIERSSRGRYLDTWSRRKGRWAIDKRHFVHDLSDLREATLEFENFSRRDSSDPSYAVLASAGRN